MVQRPDHAADRVEHHLEVDQPRGKPLRDDPHEHEDQGHQHRGEQLQEILDPQVDDPEPPEVADCERGLRMGQQADRVERRDRQRAVKKQPGQVAPALRGKARTQPPVDDHHPEHHPDDQQVHPEPPQLEVFPSLRPEERPQPAGQEVVVTQILAPQAAEDDHRQRAEQHGREQPLAAGSRPAIKGARKMPAAR